MRILVLLLLLLSIPRVHGVSGDEVKPAFATEGESVTLHTNVTATQSDDMILWSFGQDDTVIVRDSVIKFTDRIKLDKSTGSLTINNITANFSGIYKLHDVRKSSYKSLFHVMVYARLPVPVISNSTQCYSSLQNCSVVCSVVNVSHVTLSWLKGNSLLSSTSVSDLSISLSLPLEVEDQDTNIYICALNNSITHQTTHLDISEVCQPCEAEGLSITVKLGICAGVLLPALVLGVVMAYCLYKRFKKEGGHDPKPENIPLNNGPLPSNGQDVANPNNGQEERNPLVENPIHQDEVEHLNNDQEKCDHDSKMMKYMATPLHHTSYTFTNERDQIKKMEVKRGQTITLNSGVTHIQMDDLLKWKYTDCTLSDRTANFNDIAEIQKRSVSLLVKGGKFKDRLQLDLQTGDLTIKDMAVTDSGHYRLKIKSHTNPVSKTFNVTVHDEKSSTQTGGKDLNETMLTLMSDEDPNDTSTCTVESVDCSAPS